MDDILNKLKLGFSVLIPFMYVILGVYVIVEKIFVVKIPEKYAYSMGVVLILYGIYRIYRVYKMMKSSN